MLGSTWFAAAKKIARRERPKVRCIDELRVPLKALVVIVAVAGGHWKVYARDKNLCVGASHGSLAINRIKFV